MEETMNTGVEVTTDVSGVEEVSQEIVIEDYSGGPSKTFVGLVVGGIAAVVIGATVAWKRHKKKKANNAQEAEEDFDIDEEIYDENDKEFYDKTVEETTEILEFSKETEK